MCNYRLDQFYQPENIFCCSCFSDLLVFFKQYTIYEKYQKCHVKIVKFMRNVDIKSELYSIFVNNKRDCMLICKEHLGIFIYLFLETDRTHENKSYIFLR